MQRARTVDEYITLIKDSLPEVDEMRAAIEFDEEGMGNSLCYILPVEQSLKGIFVDLKAGKYCWNTGDLAYIPVIRELNAGVIPFRPLLLRINDRHRNGLEVEEVRNNHVKI